MLIDHPQVVSWFQQTRAQLQASNNNTPIPSLAFVHIPPSIAAAFQTSGQRRTSTEPGLNVEILTAQADTVIGADFPFLQALAETDDMMAVFSGHDHGVDWYLPSILFLFLSHSVSFGLSCDTMLMLTRCMKYSNPRPLTSNNLHLCFGRHTGYGGYSDWMRGGRHIVIDKDTLGQNVLETWVRLEDGTVSGRVTLNETYSTDTYPSVRRKKSFAFETVVDQSGDSSNSKVVQSTASGWDTATSMNASRTTISTELTTSYSTIPMTIATSMLTLTTTITPVVPSKPTSATSATTKSRSAPKLTSRMWVVPTAVLGVLHYIA
jgi:hypothetical protein